MLQPVTIVHLIKNAFLISCNQSILSVLIFLKNLLFPTAAAKENYGQNK